ncbi:metallophosphoesterase [Endothiovibrio diazotrophicus]
MWSRLVRRLLPARRRPPSLPVGVRVYAIGDVHGRDDLLGVLHRRIAEDLARSPAAGEVVLIHLGDYVDRGPASRAVLERLLGPLPAGITATVHLIGNHEELLLAFLDDPGVGRAWLQLGGDATLADYGVPLTPDVPPAARFAALSRALGEAMPATHRALLQSLVLHHRIGDYLFVHAGILPGRSLERQRREELLWIRDEFIHSRADHGVMVVHGHHIVPAPEEHPNRIAIDTGAYHSGVLTALVLEGSARRYLSSTLGDCV